MLASDCEICALIALGRIVQSLNSVPLMKVLSAYLVGPFSMISVLKMVLSCALCNCNRDCRSWRFFVACTLQNTKLSYEIQCTGGRMDREGGGNDSVEVVVLNEKWRIMQ